MRAGLFALIWMSTPAVAEVPRVMTDIPPVRAIVAAVMQGVGDPEVLLAQGQSPHGYAMRPSQARALAQADLVIWVGPELTGWLEGPLANLSDAGEMRLLQRPVTERLEFRDMMAFSAEGESHDDSDEHDQDHGTDPHAWLDPVNATLWAGDIAKELGRLDPLNAETYQSNANTLRLDVVALTADISTRFANLETRGFIVLHDAYHYFEHRFGLEASGAVFDGHAAPPGPQQIASLRQRVQAKRIACAFAEPQQNTDLLNTIADGMDLEVAILDPLGDGTSYPALLKNMAKTIEDCLTSD